MLDPGSGLLYHGADPFYGFNLIPLSFLTQKAPGPEPGPSALHVTSLRTALHHYRAGR